MGVVQPLQAVPHRPFGSRGGAGDLAGGHHPMPVEQDQQVVGRATGGTQPGEVGTVSHDGTAVEQTWAHMARLG